MRAESLLPWNQPEGKVTMALADDRDVVMVAGRFEARLKEPSLH
jgi:hypothetical protein